MSSDEDLYYYSSDDDAVLSDADNDDADFTYEDDTIKTASRSKVRVITSLFHFIK